MYKVISREPIDGGKERLTIEFQRFAATSPTRYTMETPSPDAYITLEKYYCVMLNLEWYIHLHWKLMQNPAYQSEEKNEAIDKCYAGVKYMLDNDCSLKECCSLIVRMQSFLIKILEPSTFQSYRDSFTKLNALISFCKEEIK